MTAITGTGLVLVNYGSHALLEENVPSFVESDGVRVVVVDNFSSDEERTAIRLLTLARGWELVERPNVGFGSGMDAGVAHALESGCTVVVLLNPDARSDAPTLLELARRVREEPEAVLCPVILRPDGSTWFDGASVLLREGRTTTRPGTVVTPETGWLTGACLALHADLWRRVGGFDEDYFLYWEDVDLSWRCSRAGGRLAVVRDLSIVHDVGGTQQGAGKSPVYVYYNCRNRLVFAAKHLSPALRLRWLASSVAYAKQVLYRGGRRAFLSRAPRLLASAVRGTLAGGAAVLMSLVRDRVRG